MLRTNLHVQKYIYTHTYVHFLFSFFLFFYLTIHVHIAKTTYKYNTQEKENIKLQQNYTSRKSICTKLRIHCFWHFTLGLSTGTRSTYAGNVQGVCLLNASVTTTMDHQWS
jgi:hypothetical protein